ncbi:hypothetical protein KAU33_01860 [Candidatus Dependentiae bacterium]|nr:hypothetical protein [Candidatus Dependentiae bacterium]
MKGRFIILVCFLILIPISVCARTYKVVLFQFENLGLNNKEFNIANHLLRDELENSKRFDLIPNSKLKQFTSGKQVSDKSTAVKYSRLLNADKCIMGSFLKLGDKIVIRFKLIDVLSGEVEFNDEVESKSVSDLNVVFARIVRGLEVKKPFESTATVDTVTLDERTLSRKRESFFTYGMRWGFFYPREDSYGGEDRMLFFIPSIQFEVPKLITKFDFGFAMSLEVLEYSMDICFMFPFTRSDICPYLSLGMGVHFLFIKSDAPPGETRIEDITGSGFALNGGWGMLFFRTYNFRILFDVKGYYSFIDLADKANQYGVAFTLGFYFNNKSKQRRVGK